MDIKWVEIPQKAQGGNKRDKDVYINIDKVGNLSISLQNNGSAAVASGTTYIEISHPNAYTLHFRQYNLKPKKNCLAFKVHRTTAGIRLKRLLSKELALDFVKWAGRKYRVLQDHETNTFYIKLEEGENIGNRK